MKVKHLIAKLRMENPEKEVYYFRRKGNNPNAGTICPINNVRVADRYGDSIFLEFDNE